LALLALSALLGRARTLLERLRQSRAQKRREKLDWTLIDNTMNSERLRRDCERQESLGICTGKDCQVYESCDFNIKKVVH
jgi:hypothetical protein